MTNLLPSVMRTGVPIVYALLIKLGVGQLGLPDAVVINVATVALAGALYLALRGLEALEPRLGVLLGWVGAPAYGAATDTLEQVRSATKPELDAALTQLRKDIGQEIGKQIEVELNKTARAAVRRATVKSKTTSASSIAKG